MRSQRYPWSCGPAALVNAGRALGVRFSEGRVRKLAGTTKEHGTDEDGLISAARELGLTASENHTADVAAAWAFVRSNVLDGRPCLLCADDWGHWVTAVGLIGDRLLVVDPSNSAKNRREGGVHPLSRRELTKRWRHRLEDEPFYALAVGR